VGFFFLQSYDNLGANHRFGSSEQTQDLAYDSGFEERPRDCTDDS
jgi:hypothetical protein